ncbi:MAG: hypothetical protein ACJ8H8_22910 [Geminicoccaceae bacterium]
MTGAQGLTSRRCWPKVLEPAKRPNAVRKVSGICDRPAAARGLMTPYWKVARNAQATIVVIQDRPENILERIVFFDIDSQPLQKAAHSAADRRLFAPAPVMPAAAQAAAPR